MKLYGISNCDTVKKARAWLSLHGKQVDFHDFKQHGISAALLTSWLSRVEWEALLPLPVEEVRTRLGVGAPPVYRPVRSAELRAA